jgi:hypothetical protein
MAGHMLITAVIGHYHPTPEQSGYRAIGLTAPADQFGCLVIGDKPTIFIERRGIALVGSLFVFSSLFYNYKNLLPLPSW